MIFKKDFVAFTFGKNIYEMNIWVKIKFSFKNISNFFSPSPKIIKIYFGYFFNISLKADINNEKFFCFVSLPIPTIILLSLKSKLDIFLNFFSA